MKTYWDYSEKERANLSREQVEKLCQLELMGEGVIVSVHPGEAPVKPEINDPKITVYGVTFKGSSYHTEEVFFLTREEAVTFATLKPVCIKSDYRLGSKYEAVEPYDSHNLVEKEVFNVVDHAAFETQTKKYAAEKEAYDKLLTQWNNDNNAAAKCCENLWDDYSECRVKLEEAKAVTSRWAEYVENCEGDTTIAARFLRKAYEESRIAIANDWCDAGIPALDTAAEAAPALVEA